MKRCYSAREKTMELTVLERSELKYISGHAACAGGGTAFRCPAQHARHTSNVGIVHGLQAQIEYHQCHTHHRHLGRQRGFQAKRTALRIRFKMFK